MKRLPFNSLRAVDVALALSAIAVVMVLYWPVHHAEFVWDDKLCFRDAAWLRHGDWSRYLFNGFCGWNNYFRPLGVALFALELRVFNVAPGPIHAVSLGIHLANMALVWLLAKAILGNTAEPGRTHRAAIAALVYGIHPALVEPVVWIGCQFDLEVTFFALLALLLNLGIGRNWLRAILVPVAFFLGACCKELAAAIPPLIVLTDFLCARLQAPSADWRTLVRTVFRRQAAVYAGLVVAGMAYLWLRRGALGHLVLPTGHESFVSIAHFQEVLRLYVTYLRIAIWPMVGLGPLHVVSHATFARVDFAALAIDTLAACLLAFSAWLAWKRKPAGFCLLAVAVALAPVLHLVPVEFNESAYHERYLLLPLAVACAMLPSVLDFGGLHARAGWVRGAGAVLAGSWLLLAALNVRATIPLWSRDLDLWMWALRQDPGSVVAKDHLLTTYIDLGMHRQARALADSLVASNVHCPNCMLNAANEYVALGDAAAAQAALHRLDNDRIFLYDRSFLRAYILAKGGLLELQHDMDGAEEAFREVVRTDPMDPDGQTALARLLIRRGRLAEGRTVMQTALGLYAPKLRAEQQKAFDALVTKVAKSNAGAD